MVKLRHFKQLVVEVGKYTTLLISEEEVNNSEDKKDARSKLEEKIYNKCKEIQSVKIKNKLLEHMNLLKH